jgi:hypothetical protein
MTVKKYTVSHGTAPDDSLDTILCHPKATFPFDEILDFCGKQLEAELKSSLAIAIAVQISLARLLTCSSIHRGQHDSVMCARVRVTFKLGPVPIQC